MSKAFFHVLIVIGLLILNIDLIATEIIKHQYDRIDLVLDIILLLYSFPITWELQKYNLIKGA